MARRATVRDSPNRRIHNQACHFLRLVHLDIVACARQQEQIGGRERPMEASCQVHIQVRVAVPEDDPDGTIERCEFMCPHRVRPDRGPEVAVEHDEGRNAAGFAREAAILASEKPLASSSSIMDLRFIALIRLMLNSIKVNSFSYFTGSIRKRIIIV